MSNDTIEIRVEEDSEVKVKPLSSIISDILTVLRNF